MQDKLGQDPIDVKKNIRIGLLHDAGKLLMTQQNLETPHMTVGNERAQMALHARLGTTVLSNSILNKEEQGGVEEHHYDTDNKYAKIVTVADCLDTMLSQRRYNNPKTPPEAVLDLVRNMYPQPKFGKDKKPLRDENGEIVYKPAQFDRDAAIAAIVALANDFGGIGYDLRKMLEPYRTNWNNEQVEEAIQILNEHSNDIVINLSPKEVEYSELGMRLTDTGHIDFKGRAAAVVNRETRVNSEYEFEIFRNSSEEQKAAARTIKDLEANFLPEQLAEFKQIAEAKINTQDEKGRKAKEAGFVANRKKNEFQAPSKNGEFKLINIAEQIRAAAEEDKDYNENGANKFIDEINRARKERQNDREEKGA